jgi:hypothetical protein
MVFKSLVSTVAAPRPISDSLPLIGTVKLIARQALVRSALRLPFGRWHCAVRRYGLPQAACEVLRNSIADRVLGLLTDIRDNSDVSFNWISVAGLQSQYRPLMRAVLRCT